MYNIVEIVNDLELDIKRMIKEAIFSVPKAERLMKNVSALLDKELSTISNEDVIRQTKKSLMKFAIKQWKHMVKQYNLGGAFLLLGLSIKAVKVPTTDTGKSALQMAVNKRMSSIDKTTYKMGLSNLADSYPTTREAYMPLDSQVEMWKRHEDQQSMVDNLKEQTDLVIVSSHANCSPRCAFWQGKVLSLSNKTGKTSDGKKIYPLSKATDVYVTTKSGKVWKNGLLGFNCRHQLLPYSPGMRQPFVSEKQRNKEYEIELVQRDYERQIRKHKTNAILLDGQEAQEERLRARELTNKYRKFCVSKGRAFYQSRIVM